MSTNTSFTTFPNKYVSFSGLLQSHLLALKAARTWQRALLISKEPERLLMFNLLNLMVSRNR